MMAAAFRTAITNGSPADILRISRGIEKEGLRVSKRGHVLSQKPHPTPLGSALTHKAITTDYSEALLEFITGVHDAPEGALNELYQLHAYTAQSLPDEIIWGSSMPGELGPEHEIPIAHYGSSNIGMMKRVYRNGLSARYGRTMQVIAGIHYNFSLPDAFWELSRGAGKADCSLKDWRTRGYLALIRNFQSHGWLLNLLTGSSPALDRSFVRDNPPSHLQSINGHTLFGEFATSLRMGDLGYTSSAQDGLQICYNQLDTYIETLTKAIVTPHDAYTRLPNLSDGERSQLNDGLLQIENEFYSAIRPKRVTQSGEAPVRALEERGIEYVEVRCLDINPFMPIGINDEIIALVDTFLLSCVISESPLCDPASSIIDNTNTQRILNFGRDPSLQLLTRSGQEVARNELAKPILDSMHEAATWLDNAGATTRHSDAVTEARGMLMGDTETPSARVLREMSEQTLSFAELMGSYAEQWNREFEDHPMPSHIKTGLADEAIASLRRQREIEAADGLSFDAFLSEFYAQYRS
ncbi:MAG: glutamate--cysteine ligase [Luminiphilus sp.]